MICMKSFAKYGSKKNKGILRYVALLQKHVPIETTKSLKEQHTQHKEEKFLCLSLFTR